MSGSLRELQAPLEARYRAAPVGFRAIRLRFDLDTTASEEEQATLLRLTERYCVVRQTLTGGVDVALVH
jgi:uncharacterized OsmC-like protein